jgi:integrase
MKSENYSISYIMAIQREIRWLLENPDSYKWSTYEEALHDRASAYDKKIFTNTKTIFSLIRRFEEDSVYPDRTKHHEDSSKLHMLNTDFENMAASFETMEEQRPLKPVTVKKNCRCFRSFLWHLQVRGCKNASDITEADSISFFRDKNGTVLRGYTAKRIISHALTLLEKNGFSECKRLSAFIPLIKYHHKNAQFLTDDEVTKILSSLKDKEGNLSLRNRAIGFLLIYTGMRASDISSLKLEDIDWHKGKIHCIQQKTGVPLHLPLLPVVGNAIYDYLDKERPQSSSDYLFLSSLSAEGLAPSSIGSISYVIYKASCVRNAKGDRRGTHIFRHHLVTALLSNGTDQATISQTVGHSSPESLAPYLHADIENLRKCALDISQFPIRREGC